MLIKSFEDANKVLEAYVPPGRSMRPAYTLDRMRQLMEALGNPQDNYKTIHVAGTSGKTSTCYYITSMLKQTGKKVGLTVSPHVDSVNERVQIDLAPLPEAEFCKELSRFIKTVNGTGIKPTYFELLVAFAYWEFDRQKVDYAVVEVGLGGLLDGTNVIHRPDKVCIITDIGMDHTEVLGRTLEAIAAQKAGIIKPYNKVITYQQQDRVMAVLREVSSQQQAELHEIVPLKPEELPGNLPLFQRRNWYLALRAANHVIERDGLSSLNEKQLEDSSKTYIPARMEVLSRDGKTIILDAAHNAQKLEALGESLKKMFPGQEVCTLFSLVQSKDFRLKSSIDELRKISDSLIITTFATQQDMHKRSVNPKRIAEYCKERGFEDFTVVADPKEAFGELIKRPEPVLLVVGSFYLLNHIRPLLSK